MTDRNTVVTPHGAEPDNLREPPPGAGLDPPPPPGIPASPRAGNGGDEIAKPGGVNRWSPAMTVLLTIGLLVISMLIQIVVLVGFGVAQAVRHADGAEDPAVLQESIQPILEANFGWVLSLSLVVSAPPLILAVLGLAKLRGPVRQYLALKGFSWKAGLMWTGACGVFLAGFEILSRTLERPPVPDFMVEAYTTIGYLPLLYIAIVVAAPLFEELLFRGFLLPPLADSRLGATGAVILTAAAFAVVHLQYDLFDMSAVFGLGVLLGAARLHSGSTTLVILLHAAINLVATVQVGWVIGGG